jgi:hypothetical protein
VHRTAAGWHQAAAEYLQQYSLDTLPRPTALQVNPQQHGSTCVCDDAYALQHCQPKPFHVFLLLLPIYTSIPTAPQVAGVGRTVTNLSQLVCQTKPPPRICDFDREQISAAFGDRAWSRVTIAMNILVRMQLLTTNKRRRAQQESSYENQQAQQQQQEQQDGETEQQQEQQLQGTAGQDVALGGWVQADPRLVSGSAPSRLVGEISNQATGYSAEITKLEYSMC